MPENSEGWAVPWYDAKADKWLMHLCDDVAAAEEFAALCCRTARGIKVLDRLRTQPLDHPWMPPALVDQASRTTAMTGRRLSSL